MAATSPEAAVAGPPSATALNRSAHFAVLTGMRGFAALAVVLIHTSGRTDFLWLGIKGFGPISLFVLSGFLLYRPWALWTLRQGSRPSYRVFAIRRIARIYPAYLAVFFIVLMLYPPSAPNGPDGWLRAISLTGIFASDGLRPGLEQTWSLGTELSWYLALPLLALIPVVLTRGRTPKQAYWITMGLLSLSYPIAYGWQFWIDANNLYLHYTYTFWLPAFLHVFATGAMVCLTLEAIGSGVVSLRGFRKLVSNTWAMPVLIGIALAVNLSELSGPDAYVPATYVEKEIRSASALLMAVGILVFAVFGPATAWINKALASRPMLAAGRWSYGIYLWHLPVIVVLYSDIAVRTDVLGLVVALAVVLAITIPLGAASYAWVEKPAIDWSHRRSRSLSAPASGAGSAVKGRHAG